MYIEAAKLSPMDPDENVQIALGLLFNISQEYDKAVDCFRTVSSSLTLSKQQLTKPNNKGTDEETWWLPVVEQARCHLGQQWPQQRGSRALLQIPSHQGTPTHPTSPTLTYSLPSNSPHTPERGRIWVSPIWIWRCMKRRQHSFSPVWRCNLPPSTSGWTCKQSSLAWTATISWRRVWDMMWSSLEETSIFELFSEEDKEHSSY